MIDGEYQRVRVVFRDLRRYGQNRVFVECIDSGKKTSIKSENLVNLPLSLRENKIGRLSKYCELAALRVNKRDSKDFAEAGYFLNELVMKENKKLTMKILYDDRYRDKWHVELFNHDKISLNQIMAREGHVIRMTNNYLPYLFRNSNIDKNKQNMNGNVYIKQYLNKIRINIDLAKEEHKNVYKYGDIFDDSDESD